MRLVVLLFYFIPKNLLSQLTGVLANIPLTGKLGLSVKKLFIKFAKINMAEAEKTAAEYGSVEDIFTRKLKEGERPIGGELVSPCDGTLLRSEKTEGVNAVQVKGKNYRLDELMSGMKLTNQNFEFYQTIYLAPHNYHRVHSPVEGTLVNIRHIEGELWPVNMPFVNHFNNLYVENERLIFKIKLSNNSYVYLAMVAALNVGKITPAGVEDFHKKRQNNVSDERFFDIPLNIPLKAGSELGTFELGSTVVIAYEKGAFPFEKVLETKTSVKTRMGESLFTN